MNYTGDWMAYKPQLSPVSDLEENRQREGEKECVCVSERERERKKQFSGNLTINKCLFDCS